MTDGDRALIRVSGALASGDKVALADAFSQARGVALAEAERFLDDEGRRSAAALWEKARRSYAG